jgi:hypothetical protein
MKEVKAILEKVTVAQSDKEQKQIRHDKQKQCTKTNKPRQHNPPPQQNETQDTKEQVPYFILTACMYI